jgi:hypothetical protein
VLSRAGDRRALATALALAAMDVGAAGERAVVPDGFYGLNVHQVFSGPAVDTHLSAMAAGGLQLGRTDARWSHIEPGRRGGAFHRTGPAGQSCTVLKRRDWAGPPGAQLGTPAMDGWPET